MKRVRLNRSILKRTILIVIFIFSFIPVFSVDINASVNTSNYAFKLDGTRNGKIPNFGFNLMLEEEFSNHLKGCIGVKRTAGFGNAIWGKITYVTEYMNISIGPSLGFFNTETVKKDFMTLFQPGIGTGLEFKTPIGLMASVEANVALPLIKVKKKTIYLQDGFFELGWRFPHIIASFKVRQDNKTAIENSTDETYVSITDIGFHTVSFSKPSQIRIPLNILYRISRYEKVGTGATHDEFASVIIETGIIHSVNADVEWFAQFGASVYSFSTKTGGGAIKKFFYDGSLGLKWSINN